MSVEDFIEGRLFARNFLCEAVKETADWRSVDDAELDRVDHDLTAVFERFPRNSSPNERQTEEDLIWPVLRLFGWTESLHHQNLSVSGRRDVPHGLLFADQDARQRANDCPAEWKRYGFGLVLVEARRWDSSLDSPPGSAGAGSAPSTQMLRYLRRADDLTSGRLRWGILTNGNRWRLYYQGAQSVAEQFFEIDLGELLSLPENGGALFAVDDDQRRHCLRLAMLVFRRESFLRQPADPRTFHQRAIDEGRFHEERVAGNLYKTVFRSVFPELARAIADQAPHAPLDEVREAALILLYRLLFIFYAEDRDLLPVRERRYAAYAVREAVREDVRRRKDSETTFSTLAARYWAVIDDLCQQIDSGDPSIGLPPYDGGLFDREKICWLKEIRLSDFTMANVIDALSFEHSPEGRRYINYRDLSIQQLGSIYERLIEQEVARDGGDIVVRPNVTARKDTGSYYTPDDLVGLIIRETVQPLVDRHVDRFADEAARRDGEVPGKPGIQLEAMDPAERMLELRICDPAMGSGHFLVALADYLADQVITAMSEAEATVEGYASPLAKRIVEIRDKILSNAKEHGWTIDKAKLDDRQIVRRIVVKRCLYGVDKSPMAVELAKLSLWLHTLTIGAPLSFLDHHLQCGDSLSGLWVRKGIEKAEKRGGSLLLKKPIERAMRAEQAVQVIEGLTDAEIAEAFHSADLYSGIAERTSALKSFLSLIHAFDWMNIRDRNENSALGDYFAGVFGDPIDIATGQAAVSADSQKAKTFARILRDAQRLAGEERFLHWQVSFPGVWSEWDEPGIRGGFDAVIGNPPWERMRLEEVGWFSQRRPEIAMATKAADRKQMVARLRQAGDPLFDEFDEASSRARNALRMAREGGDFPLLAHGDINLYSLFVERSMSIVRPNGIVGLLAPSEIATDKSASTFFGRVTAEGRLQALYDFDNRRPRFRLPKFFPELHNQQKFCVLVVRAVGQEPEYRVVDQARPIHCAFFLQHVDEVNDPSRRFPLSATDFALVNPNTRTAPIFRTRAAAHFATRIYRRLPVLVDRSAETVSRVWPVAYQTMFHMTNDSDSFRTREELEKLESAWPIGNKCYGSPKGTWMPLYEGKMVQAFDHRAASVLVNPQNRHRPAQPLPTTVAQHQDPGWKPDPQYWVLEDELRSTRPYSLAFKDVTAPTNSRSMIAAMIPRSGQGNTLPTVSSDWGSARDEALLLANFNSIPFDWVARQKIQGQHLNWFIVEQLPVVPPEVFQSVSFGTKSAAEVVREAVLELTYVSRDMAPFARDMGFVDASGEPKAPYRWDESRRISLRAKLDAVFFHLYGITDRSDVEYVYSAFSTIRSREIQAFGSFSSRDLCLSYMNALAAGQPDASIQ